MSTIEAPLRTATHAVPEPARRTGQDQERHLQLVPRAPRRRSRRRLLGAFLIVLVLTTVFCAVASHVVLLQGQQHLDHLTEQNAAVQKRYYQLRLQVDRLEAPARIVEEATRQGLVQPTDQTWLTPSSPDGADKAAPVNDDDTTEDQAQVKPYLGTAP